MKWMKILYGTMAVISLLALCACQHRESPNQEMISLLAGIDKKNSSPENPFCAEARLRVFDSAYRAARNGEELLELQNLVMISLLEYGDEEKAVKLGEDLLKKIPLYKFEQRKAAMKGLALAYLRLGERINCIKDHTAESCIFPVAGRGVHADKSSSARAIALYSEVLNIDQVDLESRWLLNIAYMTTGGYPAQVPAPFLIAGLDADTVNGIAPFKDAAVNIGLNTNNLAGGSVIDDFNNDGHLDLITSSWSLREGMRYCRNNADGTFTDISDSSELGFITGGLNLMQTDYNNDGYRDVFVVRGGWMKKFGEQPNSLLKNNGDGTFTDVTKESGLLSFCPTQTATWADFNNDGWLDVFIGNETSSPEDVYPCELFLNNRNGTFTEVAADAGCDVKAFVKGVTSGDYDRDGLTDIFISTLDGRKILLKNKSSIGNGLKFDDVSMETGLSENTTRTFPTWFWDYDNDGWLDILVCGYEYDGALSKYSASQAMNIPTGKSGRVFLYRNDQKGGFEEVSEKLGLTQFAFAMGSNFGDIDNDGYSDIYLGTGNPLYQSLVPNKMFRNINGQRFQDITTAARLGNLQKGHSVSFADLDNDGDQDIHIEMGGAYDGDAYQNSLYINPGQNKNNWIKLTLEGSTSNRAAIGAKIKVTFSENGESRSVYRDVNSGGSFGGNPLMQHIGIGTASAIETVEITWPAGNKTQIFKNIKPNENLKIREGVNAITRIHSPNVDFTSHSKGIISCAPK